MFLRSPALRLATALAGGALVALTAAGPSTATARSSAAAADQTYWGRITARAGLVLRDSPNRSGRVVRTEPFNAVVPIYCKTRGENVGGNNLWYLLTDGAYAWGSARYIANIGTPPRWC